MMHLSKNTSARQPRGGAILLIVITMLTLFAVVGLAFVFYAEATATAAQLSKESTSFTTPEIHPELAAALFLSQLIYGTADTTSSLYNQDLARNTSKVFYTYPDGHNLYLAAVRADGTVLARTGVRKNSTGATIKTLRPGSLRPGDFDNFGDVKNLPYGSGPNDAIWIDIGAPIMVAPNGQKYKMLVAPLIIDLDCLLNVNVHGKASASARVPPLGPADVNLEVVLKNPVSEYANLFAPGLRPNIAVSNLEALYRFGDTGSPALTSDLFIKLRGNLDPVTYAKVRRMLTTDSWWRDPGGINVNRPLKADPADADYDKDRQILALELYTALIKATGAIDPNSKIKAFPPTSPEYAKARELAQLAVNIVDYIDADNNVAFFKWYDHTNATANNLKDNYVFGTERPRLVLNEVHSQLDNDSTDPPLLNPNPALRTAGKYKLNVWVELFNPSAVYNPSTADESLLGYQLLVCKKDTDVGLLDAKNRRGELPFPPPSPGIILGTMPAWTAADKVTTAVPYAVVGPPPIGSTGNPSNFLPGRDPGIPPTYANVAMSCPITLTDITEADVNAGYKPVIVWRRLAKPTLLVNDPNEPGYVATNPLNPYVTIDIAKEKIVDNREYKAGSMGQVNPLPSMANFSSRGRKQPYGNPSMADQQKVNGTNPKHTFGAVNDPIQTLPDPFVWKDAALESVLDLLHMPGFRPHELTQRFKGSTTSNYNMEHYARWFDDTAANPPIYRFLDALRTKDVTPGTLVPGRININTIWDPEIWHALCDDPNSLSFWNAMINARSIDYGDYMVDPKKQPVLPSNFDSPNPPNDRPFVGFADTAKVPGASLHSTILSQDGLGPFFPNGKRTLGIPGPYPIDQWKLLTKIHPNITYRSNVFAVWATVGFFEIDPASLMPTEEIGRSENRQVRHRFFAIIDRSNIHAARKNLAVPLLDSMDPSKDQLKLTAAATPGNEVEILGMPFPLTPAGTHTVQVGDMVIIEPDEVNEETVAVTAVTANSFKFTPQLNHPVDSRIRLFRGPWINFSPRNDSTVVRHFSVID